MAAPPATSRNFRTRLSSPKLPLVLHSRGIATPADAAMMIQLSAEDFRRLGHLQVRQPGQRDEAIVKAAGTFASIRLPFFEQVDKA